MQSKFERTLAMKNSILDIGYMSILTYSQSTKFVRTDFTKCLLQIFVSKKITNLVQIC